MDILSLSKRYYCVDDQFADAVSCETSSEACLFDGHLQLYPQNMECRAIINRNVLSLRADNGMEIKVLLADILGCRLVGSIRQQDSDREAEAEGEVEGEETVCVMVNAMVRTCRKVPRSKTQVGRQRLEQSVHFRGADALRSAERFCATLSDLCTGVKLTDGSIRRFAKPLLIIINPNSGNGRSVDKFQSDVKPLFDSIGVPHELLITEHAGHATQHVESCNLDNYSGIVMVSGDGIIFEVVNALLSRPDWQRARKTPIGVLPGGSGNALATSVAFAAGESFRRSLFPSALYVLCKHQVLPLDLILFQTRKRYLYGFLELSWGYVADVDIESESLRALGGLRFQVYGIHRILFKRTRRARLTYLPYEEGETEAERSGDGEMTDRHKFTHLPPLEEPIAADDTRWRVLETSFFNITIQNRPFLTSDSYMYPELDRFDPGYMIALILHDGIPRLHVLKQLLAEDIVSSPYIETIRMKAFRFEPLDDEPSLIVVDGERIEYGPIQAEILPRAGRVLGLLKNPGAGAGEE